MASEGDARLQKGCHEVCNAVMGTRIQKLFSAPEVENHDPRCIRTGRHEKTLVVNGR